MTAILIAAGLGHVNIDKVRQSIENCEPVRKSNIYNIPAYGLYLSDVEYKREGNIFSLWLLSIVW